MYISNFISDEDNWIQNFDKNYDILRANMFPCHSHYYAFFLLWSSMKIPCKYIIIFHK